MILCCTFPDHDSYFVLLKMSFFFFFFLLIRIALTETDKRRKRRLGSEDTCATDGLDLGFSTFGEEFGFDDHGLFGKNTFAQNFEDASFGDIDDGDSVFFRVGFGVFFSGLFRNEGPDAVEVDGRTMELVCGFVEVPHTDLTEVTGVILVHPDSVVVLTTSVTTTPRMLSMFANATITSLSVASVVTGVFLTSRHPVKENGVV